MAKFIGRGVNSRGNLKQMFLFLGNVAIALAGIGAFLLLLTLIPFFYLADALAKLWKLRRAREGRKAHSFIHDPQKTRAVRVKRP